MEIKSSLTNRSGQTLEVVYRDIENEKEFGDRHISGIHTFCFCNNKLVIVYSEEKGYWTPPGGGVEEGESVRDASSREVKEETNMRVIKQRILGYQDIFEPGRVVSQARFVCLAEPIGPFMSDPDGDVTEIRLIDPQDYKQYFDWGIVGEHLMQRALEAKAQMEAEMVLVS